MKSAFAILLLMLSCKLIMAQQTTKTDTAKTIRICVPSREAMLKNKPLYILESKGRLYEITDTAIFVKVSAEFIKDFYVIKDKATFAKYGEKGKNGVLLIKLKEKENPGLLKSLEKSFVPFKP